jgi:DNA-3-methyladenine glycosylase II
MQKRLTRTGLLEGVNNLVQTDNGFARIVSQYGPPSLWKRPQGFPTLIHIILEQQVSLASAKAAYNKLRERLTPIRPSKFLQLSDDELKKIGFSRQKTRYGRELALALTNGSLDLSSLNKRSDRDVKNQLVQIKGIGPWTADIYLIVALGRPDVWPDGDMALAAAIKQLKDLSQRPSSKQMRRMSQKWRPWRAVAARLLWHYYLSEK